MGGVVALVAGKSGVLALEQITGFLVVERLWIPLNERKIFAIVFGVAAGALLARSRRDVICRMQSLAG